MNIKHLAIFGVIALKRILNIGNQNKTKQIPVRINKRIDI